MPPSRWPWLLRGGGIRGGRGVAEPTGQVIARLEAAGAYDHTFQGKPPAVINRIGESLKISLQSSGFRSHL
jgi:hypothetical protein